MPQITLTSKQVVELANFLKKHNLTKFFLAKDQGAYVGANAGSQEKGVFESIIFYFKGMNPEKNDMWYENARYAFGGDDFGEFLNADFIFKMAEKIEPKVTIKVTATQIKMDGSFKKEAPKPTTPKIPTPTEGKAKTKGEQTRELLAKGLPVEAVANIVGSTVNSVRWHKSKMKTA